MFYSSFKKLAKFFLKQANISIYTNVPRRRLIRLINLFKPYDLGYNLIRIGQHNDGGYLVPNILNKSKYCFSPGVGRTSQFEEDLEKIGIKSFIADFSVEKVQNVKTANFVKKYISSYNSKNSLNINDWIRTNTNEDEENFILQMDVDGGELEIIPAISENNLKKFSILVIEFHYFEFIGNEAFYKLLYPLIKKILEFFEVCHIHPNNCSSLFEVSSLKFPSALEVTFLNKKFIKKKEKIEHLPNKLDQKNIINKKDVSLPSYWYD